jgi:hypothetical protein
MMGKLITDTPCLLKILRRLGNCNASPAGVKRSYLSTVYDPTEPTTALAIPPDLTSSHSPGPTTRHASAVEPSAYWLTVVSGHELIALFVDYPGLGRRLR